MRRHRSPLLALVLVVEMLVTPAVDNHPHLGGILAGLMWLVLIIVARYMVNKGVVRWVVMPLALVWGIARLLEAFANPTHEYWRAAPLAGLALSLALICGIVERARFEPRTMTTAIAEAIIAYLLIAIAFGQVYWILSQELPNAFNQTLSPHAMSTFLYFSMITMSSVGYGYIVPLNPYVRMVAAFESVTGIFYIAVVVARLVSLYSGKRLGQE
jgi:hypothetical protein